MNPFVWTEWGVLYHHSKFVRLLHALLIGLGPCICHHKHYISFPLPLVYINTPIWPSPPKNELLDLLTNWETEPHVSPKFFYAKSSPLLLLCFVSNRRLSLRSSVGDWERGSSRVNFKGCTWFDQGSSPTVESPHPCVTERVQRWREAWKVVECSHHRRERTGRGFFFRIILSKL